MRALTAAMAAMLLGASLAGAAPLKAGRSITRARALEIAREELRRQDPANEFVIEEDKTVQKDFGWVFFYAPKAYLDSHDPSDLVPGTGPLVVERLGGRVTVLTSSVPPEKAIEEFEKEWRRRPQRVKRRR